MAVRPRWTKGDGGVVAVVTNTDAAGNGAGLVSALVYYAAGRLRRVEMTQNGPRRVWEQRLSLSPRPGACGRVDSRVVLERNHGGLEAFSIETGELHWHLEHPSELDGPLRIRNDGLLLLVFEDRSFWLVDPRTGKRLDRGRVDSSSFQVVSRDCRVLNAVPQSRCGCDSCQLVDGAVAHNGGAQFRPQLWQLGHAIAGLGDCTFVALEKVHDDVREAAVAVLRGPELEAVQIVELGTVSLEREHDGASLVDGVALLRIGEATAIFDRDGHIAAFLPRDDSARIFDPRGEVCWRGNL